MVSRKLKLILSFLPVIIITFFFYFLPLLETVKYSVFRGEDFIGLERYTDFLNSPRFTHAFGVSLEISILSTIISIAIGVLIAMALRDTFIGKRISVFLFQMNISIPHIAIATMVVFLLSPTGVLSAIFYNEGWIDNWTQFPKLIFDSSVFGVIFSYCLKFIPFIGMAVLAVLQSLPRDFEMQSRSLGVGKIKTFINVVLPAIMPAIASTSMIVFAFSFGCFEVPNILLRDVTLPTLIYDSYNNYYDPEGRPMAYAAAIILSMITISVSAIYLYITSKKAVRR